MNHMKCQNLFSLKTYKKYCKKSSGAVVIGLKYNILGKYVKLKITEYDVV